MYLCVCIACRCSCGYVNVCMSVHCMWIYVSGWMCIVYRCLYTCVHMCTVYGGICVGGWMCILCRCLYECVNMCMHYMWVYVWVNECALCVGVCVSMHVEARGWCPLSSMVAFHFMFWDTGLWELWFHSTDMGTFATLLFNKHHFQEDSWFNPYNRTWNIRKNEANVCALVWKEGINNC